MSRQRQNYSDWKKQSFRRKLFINFSIAGFTFAIVAAFAYAYMASSTIQDFYKREGLHATQNFASLSELALLYDSGDNATDAALATLEFPSIKHVAIVNSEQKILLDEGSTTEKILTDIDASTWNNNAARFVSRSESTWQIVAPVYTVYADAADDAMLMDADAPADEYLGYVAIQVDTADLIAFQREAFVRYLLVGLVYGLAFVLVLNITLARVLKPLNSFARVMRESTDGKYQTASVEDDAPSEIVAIADVYNEMINKLAERDHRLRGQKDLLETEVSLRTTELVQARDSALEASRHKSEFLANITHELRTPLQSIIGYSEVVTELLDDEGIDECQGDMDKISRNAAHLLTLINSILDISKIEAGRMELNYRNVRIDDLLATVAETISPLVAKNNNQLATDIEPVEQPIFTDDQKLFQILLNLLSNAAKFTRDGTITLRSRFDGRFLVIAIEDSGIGISREQQRKVFEPFRQLDGSETREFVGTGLGLSIAMKFAHLMAGDIDLHSEVGKGSTFTVTIPIEATADADSPVDQRLPG